MASELTHQFLERFQQLGQWLKEQAIVKVLTFKTFPPVSDEEVRQVEEQIGTKLDDTFLAYFRESNGYELQYQLNRSNNDEDDSEAVGAFKIPSLSEIFDSPISNDSSKGEYQLEILGGKDDHELRNKMFAFDKYDEWRDEQMYQGVYYVVGDNVLLQSTDYEACITDSHPITVPSYMELSLTMAGLTCRRKMLERGASGNYKTIKWGQLVYATVGPWAKLIAWELYGRVTPEFYQLVATATEKRGYHLRFLAPLVIDDLNKL
jgi:hypothetical protein